MIHLRIREAGPEVVDRETYDLTDPSLRATCEEVNPPAFDPSSQKVVPRFAFAQGTWSQVWDVVPLSQEELDAKALAADGAKVRTVLEAMRTGSGTVVERVTRLEGVVLWIAKTLRQQ